MAAYKRLDLERRCQIQILLDQNKSFREIAETIGVHKTTVSREIRLYRVEHDVKGCGRINRCVKNKDCKKQFLCAGYKGKCSKKFCFRCSVQNCNTVCSDYEEYHCPKLERPPYVCNGCTDRYRCPYRKQLYRADEADRSSREMRRESRTGMNLTEGELSEIDSILSPRLRLNQSIHHIFATSQDELTISEKTAYTLLHSGLLTARPIDAPRIVRMSPRKTRKQVKVDKKCRIGRTYEDFKKYMEEHPDNDVLEGDTVEGRKGGKCLLTLTRRSLDFQIGFLRDHNDSASVTVIVDNLYQKLGDEAFHKVFPDVWLLDNGSEFSNPAAIEKYGIRVFYCDPGSPFQKGACENTHEHIRRVLPKGTSFDDLDQGFFDFLFSNINAIARKKLNDHSAYDLFSSMYAADTDIVSKLNIQYIDPKLIELQPSLIKKYYASKTNPL